MNGSGSVHPRRASRRPSPARYRLRRAAAAVVVVALALLLWRGLESFGPLAGSTGPSAGDAASPRVNPTGGRSTSPGATTDAAPPPPPECDFDDILAPKSRYRDWRLTLLDTRFRLVKTYEPGDLVPVSEAGFTGGHLVRRKIVRDLGDLREAAAEAGNPVDIIAAYRSFDQQAVLFDKRTQELGEEEALRKTARPGHSEHQLGTAVDFRRPGAKDVTERFGRSRLGRWLMDNAPRFGFVLTYPEGKESLSCYGYEPWHYRYFGRRMAEGIVASGLTAREFLWRLYRQGSGG